jgi:hypothetical protein
MSQNGVTFMQPILEWGNSAGDRYAIRNCVAVNDEYVYGKLVNVNPGTTLTGVMTLVSFTRELVNNTALTSSLFSDHAIIVCNFFALKSIFSIYFQ